MRTMHGIHMGEGGRAGACRSTRVYTGSYPFSSISVTGFSQHPVFFALVGFFRTAKPAPPADGMQTEVEALPPHVASHVASHVTSRFCCLIDVHHGSGCIAMYMYLTMCARLEKLGQNHAEPGPQSAANS